MTLNLVAMGKVARITALGGERSFRRRLMELGLLPGTRVMVLRVAPMGDPMELVARGAHLSIRRREAESITVELLDELTAGGQE